MMHRRFTLVMPTRPGAKQKGKDEENIALACTEFTSPMNESPGASGVTVARAAHVAFGGQTSHAVAPHWSLYVPFMHGRQPGSLIELSHA